MKKLILLAVLTLFSAPAIAQDSQWFHLFTVENGTRYEAMKNSFDIDNIRETQEPVFVITVREIKGSNIALSKVYVRVEHCLRKEGILAWTRMNGDFVGETDFVYGGGTNASWLAKEMCEHGFKLVREYEANKQKSSAPAPKELPKSEMST